MSFITSNLCKNRCILSFTALSPVRTLGRCARIPNRPEELSMLAAANITPHNYLRPVAAHSASHKAYTVHFACESLLTVSLAANYIAARERWRNEKRGHVDMENNSGRAEFYIIYTKSIPGKSQIASQLNLDCAKFSPNFRRRRVCFPPIKLICYVAHGRVVVGINIVIWYTHSQIIMTTGKDDRANVCSENIAG